MTPGNCYQLNQSYIAMYLGEDEELPFIKFIGIMFYDIDLENNEKKQFQIPFIPIHEDIWSAEPKHPIGKGSISRIDNLINQWLSFNNGTKTYFTVEIQKILEIYFAMLKDLDISKYELNYPAPQKTYELPIIFPTTQEILDEKH